MNKFSNLIPFFIHEKCRQKEFKGRFRASSIFVDIVGFTSMTQKLIEHGKEGAEVLSELIYQVFEAAMDSIYVNNGWVVSFAGDAFTAVFPEKTSNSVLYAALQIKRTFENLELETPMGKFKLKTRIGISGGEVDWAIVKTKINNTYYFKGEAVDRCAVSEHHCNPGEIVVDDWVLEFLGNDIDIVEKKDGYYLFSGISDGKHDILMPESREMEEEVLKKFIPDEVLEFGGLGEFRNITPLFISFETQKNLNSFIREIVMKTNQYGGYFNKVDFGDKGGIMLVIFGAPTAVENYKTRALEFARDIISVFPSVRMGITSGMAYTGIVGSGIRAEYTALGEVVNLSARLMIAAKKGQALVGSSLYRNMKDRFNFRKKFTLELKGFEEKVRAFDLGGRKEEKWESLFEGEMKGREDELNQLLDLIAPLEEGKFGGVTYIDGEAGLGKSRLVYELNQKLQNRGYNWFYLPCDEIMRESFNPMLSFLMSYFNQSEDRSPEDNVKNFKEKFNELKNKIKNVDIKNELKRTESVLAAQVNIQMEDSLYQKLNARGKYENTIYAFKNLIKAESLISPAIIVLEDAHWIDEDTGELIKVLTRNVDDYPFILIATCRYNNDGSEFRLSLPDVKEHSIELKKLEKEWAIGLMEDKLGGNVEEELAEIILSKGEGNPFYIEQIVLFLKERNLIFKENDLYSITSRDFEIPEKISTVIISRIDRLEEELKEVIRTASVLGREFSIRILSDMLKGKPLQKNLERGEDVSVWTAMTEIIYIFKHALIRDSIYEMQLKKTLRNLHRLAAEAMESTYRDEIKKHYGELAYHYEKAGVTEKAIYYLEKAAEYNRIEFRCTESNHFYERLLKYTEEDEKKIKIFLKMASNHTVLGEWEDTESICRKSIKLANELNNKHLASESRVSLGYILSRMGKYRDAIVELESAVKTKRKLERKEELVSALSKLGFTYEHLGEYEKSLKILNEGLEIAEETGDKGGLSIILGNIGVVYWNKGEYEKSIDYYERQLEISRELNDIYNISIVYGNLGIIYENRNLDEKAMEYHRKCLELSEKIGYKRGIGIAYNNIGIIYSKEGKFSRALECHQIQRDITREIGDTEGLSYTYGNIGFMYMESGEYEKAIENFKQTLNLSRKIGDKRSAALALGNMGVVYKSMNDYERSEVNLKNAIQIQKDRDIKFNLCNFQFHLAELYYMMSKFEESKINNSEAFRVAEEIKREDVIFNCRILEFKLDTVNDKEKGVRNLNKLLEIYDDKEQKADINYELFLITGGDLYRDNAAALYDELRENSYNIKYRDRYERLTNSLN